MNIPQTYDVGIVHVPGYGQIEVRDWKEDVIYDTITISSGLITGGTEYEFFSSLLNKNKDDTNMAEANKLPENWQMYVIKMGLEILPSADVRDVQAVVEQSYLRFETGNTKIRRRGPTYLWPIGYGLWNMRAVDESAATTRAGTLQIGGVAFSTVPTLLKAIHLTTRLNFRAVLNMTEAITLEEDFRCRFYLYGYISRLIH